MIDDKSIKSENRGPSLTIKWAFASSMFIFIVFTIFAVITYKTTVDLTITNEREKMEQTIQGVEERLRKAEDKLTMITTIRELQKESADSPEPGSSKDSANIQSNIMRLDSFLGELAQPNLSLYVYDTDKKLVFSTKNTPLDLLQQESDGVRIIGIDNETGYLEVKNVYSEINGKLIGYIQIYYKLDSFYEMRSELLITLLVLEFFSLVLSSVLGFFLANYFLKPLGILRNTMLAIKDDPKTDLQMEKLHTGDELEDLARIFNEMILKLRGYIEQQEQFVSDVSHELRTPVAIVEGHLSMLSRWGKDDPEVLENGLKASLEEISRMKNLVQEMLDLSRADVVDETILQKTTWGKAVVQRAVANMQMVHPEFEFEVVDQTGKDSIVQIYRNHLEQLMLIILDNAVKYSAESKKIVVTVHEVKDAFQFSIQDFGEGMSPEDSEKVFNRFYRVDKARARTKGGNGLGLAIAKKMISNYKGDVTVQSELGKGTTFTITLPLAVNQFETID